MTGELSSLTTLRRSEDRQDDREGIPMVLGLVNEVGDPPPVEDAGILAEGARIAAELDTLRTELAPTLRDDDMGCVVALVRAASYEDLAE